MVMGLPLWEQFTHESVMWNLDTRFKVFYFVADTIGIIGIIPRVHHIEVKEKQW